ncbi:MAG: DUF4175 domain-containing protein [Pelagimonas sp.]|jgi:uncharacterized protein (TIGR02302 family)|nr:DUF4175 domain-containing protein [Pelagimonas sp.]
MASDNRHSEVLRVIRWPLILTGLGMCAERFGRAFWPLWSVLFFALALLMLGVQDLVAVEWVWGASASFAILAVGFLWRGLRRFHWPRRTEVLAHLDQTLKGNPIQAVQDAPAIGADDAQSLALWQAHQDRMRDRLKTARPVRPDLRIATLDPFALRYVALLALSVAVLFGSVLRVQSVTTMGLGGSDLAQGPSWEGWMMPPSYTGLPTVYLNDITDGPLNTPEGSEIKLRLYGEVGALSISENVSGRPLGTADQEITRDFQVAQSGEIAVEGRGGRLWQVAMIPDAAPTVQAEGSSDVTYEGEATIPFTAQDDHGIVSGMARITLDLGVVDRRYGRALPPEPREAITAPLPIPVVGDRREFTEPLVANFSQHPWALLPVTLQFEVLDGAGQSGLSEPQTLVLPGRRFFDPLAAAVIEMRQAILWNRGYAGDAAQIMRALANQPDNLFHKDVQQMRYRKIMTRLERLASLDMSDAQQSEIAQSLWDLAMDLEEIDLDDARERLRRARERLEEAMKNGASQDQIEELMQELREATNDYMRQLSREQARNNQQPQPQGNPQDSMTMTMDDLQAMRDRIQQLMEEGRMDEAMEALRQYNEMVENMQITEGGQGGQSPSDQAMEGLADTLREQQDLSDESFRDLQDQFNQGRQGQQQGQQQQPGQQPGQQQGQQSGQGGQSGEQSLAERQRALRQELENQRNTLPGQGTEGGQRSREALERADEAMRGAEEALRDGDLGEAIDQQSQAMDALRDGLRGLNDIMSERQSQNGSQGTPQQGDRANGTDPLGRDSGTNSGEAGSGEDVLRGGDVYRRAEELLDELRRRSGELERPEIERRYLDRLLDRF